MQQQEASTNVGVVAPTQQTPWVITPLGPNTEPPKYQNRKSTILGAILIAVALLSIAFNVVDIVISTKLADNEQVYDYSYTNYGGYDWASLGFTGHGFWSGLMSLAAGTMAIVAGRKHTKSKIRASLVLNIVAACFCLAQLGIAIGGAVQIGQNYINGDEFCCPDKCSFYNYYHYSYYYYDYGYGYDSLSKQFCPQVRTLISMEALLGAMSLIGGALAIWISTLGCRAACCCASNRPPSFVVTAMSTQGSQMIQVPFTPQYPVSAGGFIQPPGYQFIAAPQFCSPTTVLASPVLESKTALA